MAITFNSIPSYKFKPKMEEFFQYDYTTPINFPPVRSRRSSAFIPYNDHPIRAAGGGRNVHRRMIEFLRRGWGSPVPEMREKGYRHMMNERMRREKQKQSYSTLHALLPHGTKNDKNTVVQAAAREVAELERRRRELENENREMAARLAKEEEEERRLKKIMFTVGNPSSGVHSILEVLKCLRSNGFNAKSIQSTFSTQEISAVLHLFSQDKEIEEAQALIRQTLITHTSPLQEPTKFGKEPWQI